MQRQLAQDRALAGTGRAYQHHPAMTFHQMPDIRDCLQFRVEQRQRRAGRGQDSERLGQQPRIRVQPHAAAGAPEIEGVQVGAFQFRDHGVQVAHDLRRHRMYAGWELLPQGKQQVCTLAEIIAGLGEIGGNGKVGQVRCGFNGVEQQWHNWDALAGRGVQLIGTARILQVGGTEYGYDAGGALKSLVRNFAAIFTQPDIQTVYKNAHALVFEVGGQAQRKI